MKPKKITVFLLTACICGCQSQEQTSRVAEEIPQTRDSLTSKPDRHPRVIKDISWDWSAESTKYLEKRLAEWTPQPYDRDVPMAAIRDPQIDVEGHWFADSTYTVSKMRISMLPSEHYAVELSTRGCLSNWELKRTAVFYDGILFLDKPVQDYGLDTFDRLFAVRLDGQACLLPPRLIGLVQHELDGSGEIIGEPFVVDMCTYGRAGERVPWVERFNDLCNNK